MSETRTQIWRRWFKENCSHWDDGDKVRYLNIPNDRDDIDDIELEAAKELITEINGKGPRTT